MTLRGDQSLGRSGFSLKAMLRNLRKEGGGYLVEFNFLQAPKEGIEDEQEGMVVPPFLSQLSEK